jgi:tetratricopeptide (TPR) repeat protein
MGKMQAAGATPSEALVQRLARFARLQSANALANYYYAVALSKRSKSTQDGRISTQVESLLKQAIRADPKLGLAHLQLGILYADRRDSPNAIAAYHRAIAASPELEEAHYRLAQAYRLSGDKPKSQHELRVYEQLSKNSAERIERERHEIQQFVVTLRDQKPAQPEAKP